MPGSTAAGFPAAPPSPVGTPIVGSEEYEPDAKVRGGATRAADSDDKTDIASFSRAYFGDPAAANPYHYGLLPEIAVAADGSTRVVKHYAAGRYAREMQILAADDRTAIGGDDGKNTGLFMFVADRRRTSPPVPSTPPGSPRPARRTATASTCNGSGSATRPMHRSRPWSTAASVSATSSTSP